MWGIMPAAGRGSRIQPLAFSKELLPVGSRLDGGIERPCAVSEYLVERMIRGGADKICFVISPGKSDIMEYYGGELRRRRPSPMWCSRSASGLCDAIFRAAPLIAAGRAGDRRPARHRLVSRRRALRSCPTTRCPSCSSRSSSPSSSMPWCSTRADGVLEIQVKQQRRRLALDLGRVQDAGPRPARARASSGASATAGDEYIGTLVNAYLAAGGEALGRQGRRRLCRCRHAAWLSRGDRASRPTRRGRGRARGARVALGWPDGRALRRTCTPQAGSDAMNAIDDAEPRTRSAAAPRRSGPGSTTSTSTASGRRRTISSATTRR